jgi:hypothetical protein
MTDISAAQKKKKKRAQKLLEEEQERVEVGKARQTPVSTPTPFVTPTAPIVALLAFPPGHPAANWPAHLQEYVYGPKSHPLVI